MGLVAHEHNRRNRSTDFICAIPTIPAAYFIGLFVVLAAIRLQYPFELEWMEGGVADHVEWILRGGALYAAPTVDFVAFRYTPLYHYAGAALSLIFGHTFIPLRLISILSVLGSLWIVFLFVRRDSGSRAAGVVAAGVLAACYPLTGTFYDLARVDSMFLVLALWSIYLLYTQDSLRSGLVVGVLFSLAFLTKQTAGPLAAVFVLYETIRHWRRGVLIGLTVAMIVSSVTLIWDRLSDGWYFFYTIELGRDLHIPDSPPVLLWRFFVDDLLTMFPLVLIGGTLMPVAAWILGRRREAFFYSTLWLSLLLISFLARIHPAGWTNTLIPAVAALSTTFGLGLAWLYRWLAERKKRTVVLTAILSAAVLGQFALMLYAPAPHLPSRDDEQAGRALVAQIAAIDGDVFIPCHGYLGRLAGKQQHVHFQATRDLMGEPGHDDVKQALALSIRRAIYQHRFAAIILDRDWYRPNIGQCYVRSTDPLFARRDVFYPVAGWLIRPNAMWVLPGADSADGSGGT